MPHHPSEEQTTGNLTDKVAQYSKDSNASDHPLHDENKGPVEEAAGALKSKGPQIPETKMPEAESKDKLQAKAAEMNK